MGKKIMSVRIDEGLLQSIMEKHNCSKTEAIELGLSRLRRRNTLI